MYGELFERKKYVTVGQFECDVLDFVFVFISFVHIYGVVVVQQFAYVFKL